MEEPAEAPLKLSGAKDTQLEIPIRRSSKDLVLDVKRNIDKSITYAGVLPHWRSFQFVAAFLVSIFTMMLIAYVLYLNFDKLPPEVPMIFNQAGQNWTSIDRRLLIGLPVSQIFFIALFTYWNSKIYRFDRRLVQMLSLSIVIANIFLLIGFGQILSLILIY